jgi:hypothetical protein
MTPDVSHKHVALGIKRGQERPLAIGMNDFFLMIVENLRVAEVRAFQVPDSEGLVARHRKQLVLLSEG